MVTILDILEKCKNLQIAGKSVSFCTSYGETKIEHRESANCELIISFTIRDTENPTVLDVIDLYLDGLLADVK